jgi:hypothetical protein
VLVEHSASGDVPNSTWSLTRYVRDPQIFLEVEGGDE